MRAFSIFRKTLREMGREKWMLALTLAFAPFFVWLYWLMLSGGSTSYTVLVINNDAGVRAAGGSSFNAGEQIVEAIDAVVYADGSPLLKARLIDDRSQAEPVLKRRAAAAFLLIPENFSEALQRLEAGDRSAFTQVTFGGDLSNPYYMVAASLAISAVDGYVLETTGQQPLVAYVEQPLGASAARTEFEIYVPGTLIFAVIMLIFLASMTIAREIETSTLRRLQFTPMSSIDLLGGVTAALVLIGTLSIGLAFAVALAVGFRSQGPLWIAILVGAFASLSVIGLGMLVASFTRTVSQAFIVANFPMAMMMFFSGVIYPMPAVKLFTWGSVTVGLYDILPSTHAVSALNKILTLGMGIDEVLYELSALVILSILYFAAGALIFKRMHLRAA
jgi:ABC-2 type transport system permease protein